MPQVSKQYIWVIENRINCKLQKIQMFCHFLQDPMRSGPGSVPHLTSNNSSFCSLESSYHSLFAFPQKPQALSCVSLSTCCYLGLELSPSWSLNDYLIVSSLSHPICSPFVPLALHHPLFFIIFQVLFSSDHYHALKNLLFII